MAGGLPSGVVAFVLTDVEGSTSLWERAPDQMKTALARHDELIASAVAAHGGHVIKTKGEGDSTFSVFADAAGAVAGALAIQLALAEEPWPDQTPVRARAAVHTGVADERDGDYFGPVVNRCARVRAIAHGGQTLMTEPVVTILDRALPPGTTARDLGIHRLKDLERPERIFQLCHPRLDDDFPPLRSLDPRRHNLPIELTSFIGREADVDALDELLQTERLVTLTGPGGTGKTRLALHVVVEYVDRFTDGVWVVELAPIGDPGLVANAVAEVLGLREADPRREVLDVLVEQTRERDLLLVLDNCEHVVDAAATVVRALLSRCPHIRVLATSRIALSVPGEHVFPVAPLEAPLSDRPAEQTEAVRLFVERAAAARAGFALTDRNRDAVIDICRRLSGLPLAIELAASRVRAFEPQQIAERLDAQLRTPVPRAADRHGSLHAALEWSHDLLTDEQRALLRRLSIFVGGFTLEAAERVCSGGGCDVPTALAGLVEHSLVVFDPDQMRYSMLEPVRQYGREKLLASGECDSTAEAHLDWCLAFAGGAELRGEAQAFWLDQLEREHDNLRAALDADDPPPDPEQALLLTARLGSFWEQHGHFREGAEKLERAIARADDGTPTMAWALRTAASVAAHRGKGEESAAFIDRARALSEVLGDKAGVASMNTSLAWRAFHRGDHVESDRLLDEALRDAREIGHRVLEGNIVHTKGEMARTLGRLEDAKRFYEASLAISREEGGGFGIASVLGDLGTTALYLGDLPEAHRYFGEGVRLSRALGFHRHTAMYLGCYALLSVREGHPEHGARFLGASRRIFDDIGATPGGQHDEQIVIDAGNEIRARLDGRAFDAALAEGRALTIDEAVDEALRTSTHN